MIVSQLISYHPYDPASTGTTNYLRLDYTFLHIGKMSIHGEESGCRRRRRCSGDVLDILAANLGMPDACDFYKAINTLIVENWPGVTTEDTAAIDLNGDGKGTPLSAILAPTALESTDGTVDITYNPNGTFNLSAPQDHDSTTDTASVLMSGDGTSAAPLASILAETAIASSDSSVAVVYDPADGTFDLTVATVPPGGVVHTTNSTTIAFTGDGTLGTPLTAGLTAGALTSADGSAVITQNVNGTLNIQVPPDDDQVANSQSILTAGNGQVATPITSKLASTALTSTDGSVNLTYTALGGTYDLSVPAEVDSVSSTASVDMSGTGSAATPLSSKLASGAITSTDNSVTTSYNAVTGQFDLSVPPDIVVSTASVNMTGNGSISSPISSKLANTAITSTDSSVTVTYNPAGGTFNLSVPPEVDTVASTPSIDMTGNGQVATPITSILASSALTSTDSSVTLTYTAGTGQFNLSVPSAANSSFIPRTIVVGASVPPLPSIGTTPQAQTITTALTMVPALSPGQTWTLLIMPGTYTEGLLNIQSGVCLTAFEPNTVTINSQVSFGAADTSANNYAAYSRDITFTQSITATSTNKTGGTYSVLFEDCTLSGGSTSFLNMRSLTALVQDNVQFEDCNITAVLQYNGGTTTLNQCITTGTVSVTIPSVGVSYLEINQGVIGPINVPNQPGTTTNVHVVGAVLWGFWQILGSDAQLRVSACRPVYSNNPIPQYTPWLLEVGTSAQAYLANTRIDHVVDKVDTNGNWTVTSPSLQADSTGFINRDIFISTTPPIQAVANNINITLATPLVTSPIPVAPPATGNQPIVTVVNVSAAPGFSYLSATSTNALIVIVNQVTVTGPPMNISIIPPVPF